MQNLGWKPISEGKYAQHKFHLGRDEGKACLANGRLETLWEQIYLRWRRDYPGNNLADPARSGSLELKASVASL